MFEKLSTQIIAERSPGKGPKGIRKFAIAKCREKLATRENLIANLELLQRYMNQVDFRFTPVHGIPWARMWKGSRYQEWIGKVFSSAPTTRYDKAEVFDYRTNPRYQYVLLIDRFIEVIRDTPVGQIFKRIGDCVEEAMGDNSGIDYSSFLSKIGIEELIGELIFMEMIEQISTIRICIAAACGSAMSKMDDFKPEPEIAA